MLAQLKPFEEWQLEVNPTQAEIELYWWWVKEVRHIAKQGFIKEINIFRNKVQVKIG